VKNFTSEKLSILHHMNHFLTVGEYPPKKLPSGRRQSQPTAARKNKAIFTLRSDFFQAGAGSLRQAAEQNRPAVAWQVTQRKMRRLQGEWAQFT